VRIRIDYETRYHYETAARSVAQTLRLTPHSCDSQHVASWRVDLDLDEPAPLTEDAFGNLVHSVFTQRPITRLTLQVSGEVETSDTAGVYSGVPERLDPQVFLRSTPLTEISDELEAFAEALRPQRSGDALAFFEALMAEVRARVAFRTDATTAATSAAQAFATGAGVCQDLSHIFIAVARHLGTPARYVSGHLVKLDGSIEQQAGHAWAEAFAPGLGWIGLDVANGVRPSETHVRVATGLDYLSAAPIRGVRTGGGMETMSVKLAVAELRRTQSQSQG
jgi:transglutaminase-like putative cysteine protease